jgi:prepilin-type N-terminal cleavage/methylation domain-containing protein
MVSKHNLSHITGVTLIELLIVMVLVGLLLSLVGPFTFNLIDSASARNEKMQLIRWVKSESFSSFSQENNRRFKLEGQRIYQQPSKANITNWSTLKQFEYLFFEPQILEFNKQGYPRPDVIDYRIQGVEEQLDLAKLFGSQNEEPAYE